MVRAKKNKKATYQDLKITKNTILGQILHIPEAYEVLVKVGVPCVSCPLVGFEMNFLTLESIAKTYDIDLKLLINKLNKALNKKPQNNNTNN